MKKLSLVTLILSLLLFSIFFFKPGNVTADEAKPRISPTVEKVANPIDHLKENVGLFFKFGNSKTDYYMELLNLRLAELQFSIDNQKGEIIESCASRYLTFVGRLKASYNGNHSEKQKQELKKLLELHLPILNNLRDTYESNSGLWLATQHDVNGASDLLKSL